MSDPRIEYTVWGGYEDQPYGEHWATFDNPVSAVAYREEQLRFARLAGRGKLWLEVREERKGGV